MALESVLRISLDQPSLAPSSARKSKYHLHLEILTILHLWKMEKMQMICNFMRTNAK